MKQFIKDHKEDIVAITALALVSGSVAYIGYRVGAGDGYRAGVHYGTKSTLIAMNQK